MSDFICKKCGSTEYEIKDKPNGTGIAHGLYCAKCGFWHKWLGKEELKQYATKESKDEIIAKLQSENAALRERLEKAYEFPVKYGDKIWVLDGKHLFDRYVWAIEIKSNGVFLSLSEKTMWYDRGIVSLSERGKTWFLDSEKELAEARLAELQGEEKNG